MAVVENEQSKLVRVLEVFGNLFMLNVMFLIFSIPIITIGASLSASYNMAIRIVRNEEAGICKGFVNAFKKSFKQSTLAWLLFILSMVVIIAEYLLIISSTGFISKLYIVVLVFEIIALALIVPFLFPLIGRFENSFSQMIKNAFLLSISNFGAWIKVALVWIMPAYIIYIYPDSFIYTWYLWVIIFFGLIFYLQALVFRKVFDKVGQVQQSQKDSIEEKEKQEELEKEIKRKKLIDKMATFNNLENKEE